MPDISLQLIPNGYKFDWVEKRPGLSVTDRGEAHAISYSGPAAAAKRGPSTKSAPDGRSVPELEAEIAKLRKELAQACMERDIVKMAAAYVARESLPRTRS